MQPHERDALQAAVRRATIDSEYRQRLLRDAIEAIHEETRVLISGERVKCIEKTPDTDVLVVLPDLLPAGPELTAEDLEQVAGGTAWCDTVSCETYTN